MRGMNTTDGQKTPPRSTSERMELVSLNICPLAGALFSSRPVAPSRGDHTLRAPLNGIDGSGRRSEVTGKRKRTSPGSDPLKSGSKCTGLPQYAVPESLLSPQVVYYSPRAHSLQTPPSNEIDNPDRHGNPTTTIPQPGPRIPMQPRPEAAYLALGTPCEEAQNHSCHLPPTSGRQSDEQLRAGQFLDELPNLPFHTTDKDLGVKQNTFIDETFFPSPTITDPWGEMPTPDLSWNPAIKVPFPVDKAVPTAETDAVALEAALERTQLVSDRRAINTHSIVSTGQAQINTSASIEARLSQVLKAVDAAGFDSLDSAVVAYYRKSLKGNEWLRQEQRLNRMRRLPVLLKELHLSAQGWGQWERRNFQEQIIKSTEEILFAELQDHLVARRPCPHNSPCSTEQSGQAGENKAEDEADAEAKLPNTWTLLTSLSTRYSTIASQDWQTDMPKLVGKFLAVGNDLST
ncbi:Fc.00g056080.m01.CDS01 [Cosmosporella sp. VM-42]